ncbi:ICOS ligand-like isoform X2 [Amphiprion ocellaris]|uniref:ICOS ligand-like isoform X2 n=1 Tax=Amphiprion ocellaris TaxID=80972 RepID=UPI0024110725|nr:ICOS ligand-like isoform X2 [Amphiprion ocellaris]
MSAGTSELFCLICFLVCSCTAQKIITAALGQDVILPCEAPQKNIFILLTPVKWNRPGLEPEYVFFNQGKHLDPEKQHPSYKNRVDLQDKEMKDGDFSLVLKDVTMEDNGTYECWVFQRETNDWKTWSWKIETTINLEVVEPGDKDGGDKDGNIIRSVLAVILVALASVGLLVCRTLDDP